MTQNKSEQQYLTFHKQREIIITFYLVSKDESEESQDEDEDDYDHDDEDEDGKKIMESITHQTGPLINGVYDRPRARTKPQKLSKASDIIISGIQKNVAKEVINKQLMDTYHEGGDLSDIFCSADYLGVTALAIAVLSNNCEVAECLLQILFLVHQDYASMHEYVNKTDVDGNTIVHEMAYMGDKIINTLERLLSLRICNVSHNIEHSQLQNPIFDTNKSNNDGEYPLHFCLKSPRFCTEAVQVFCNVDPNIMKITDAKENTMLHYFLLCLPQYCSTFHSSQEAANAVRKSLEFLLSFDIGRDCLLLCNKNNKTPEILLGEINNISPQVRAAATQVLRKQPKPQLLQIPLDQPSTIIPSPIPAFQFQPSFASDRKNQLSPLSAKQNLLPTIPAIQNQASTIPAMENELSSAQSMENQASLISVRQNQLSPIPVRQSLVSPIPVMPKYPFPIPAMQSQPLTTYIMENQHLTIPVMENEPSTIPDLQNEGNLLEDEDIPADPDNIVQQLVSSFHLDSFYGKSLTSDSAMLMEILGTEPFTIPDMQNDVTADAVNGRPRIRTEAESVSSLFVEEFDSDESKMQCTKSEDEQLVKEDTFMVSSCLNASSREVLSNPNDPSCGYHSFWHELVSLDPNANQYATNNLNINSLSKKWKYILRNLLPNDAGKLIHAIQEVFGIEDMNHKMFTTFFILKKRLASKQLNIMQIENKLFPILEKVKKSSQDQTVTKISMSIDSFQEYMGDEITLKHYNTLIKKLLPSSAVPIIKALDTLYETNEKKAVATTHILNRFCTMKFISLESIQEAKDLLTKLDELNSKKIPCIEAVKEAKDFLLLSEETNDMKFTRAVQEAKDIISQYEEVNVEKYKCILKRNFAFANMYKPVYDVIINQSLPETMEDKKVLIDEITVALNGIKTNKRLRDWLMEVHDQRSYFYGWPKINGLLTEEDFQLVSFEILDIFYGNKVHLSFKFLGFKKEVLNPDELCRLEKLNNVYRVALENIGDIMTNSNFIIVENNCIQISIISENEANVKTILLDQFRDIWGKAVTDESYRRELLLKLREKYPHIAYNTTEDILSLFQNETYRDMDSLQIEIRDSPKTNVVTLIDGCVLWPKQTRRLSELPNEWFTKFYGIFIEFVPQIFHESIGRTFIKNSSLYNEGDNCLTLMREARTYLFNSKDAPFDIFDHFRKNGGTVGDLGSALKECKKDDVNLTPGENEDKIMHVENLIENLDRLINDTYQKWKSSFEIPMPGVITSRKVFEHFFKNYGLSPMPKMKASEFERKIERGEILKGDQIWLWRYSSLTDSYAHVGIYVDEESIAASNRVRDYFSPVNSIVHVTSRNRTTVRHMTNTETSKITCDLVKNVVHANDEVFVVRYGEDSELTGEEIAKRALSCCVPKITFYYNGFFGSCETFAAKVCGSISVRNLNLQGFQVASQGGKKKTIANRIHTEDNYDDLIQKIDSRMMEMVESMEF